MPYSFSIYSDEKLPEPIVGELYRVTEVVQDVLDIHWGKCTMAILEKMLEPETCTCDTQWTPMAYISFLHDVIKGYWSDASVCPECGKLIVVVKEAEE